MNANRIPRLFCFGLGYSACTLAAELGREGWRIAGTVRGESDNLQSLGYEIFQFDGAAPMRDLQSALAGSTHILSSVPPGPAGDAVLRFHAADIELLSTLEWVGYLSTTGVYGDRKAAGSMKVLRCSRQGNAAGAESRRKRGGVT